MGASLLPVLRPCCYNPTMPLTAKQEKFARLIALDGLSQAEAYRQAYNADNQSPETVYPESSTLANHNPKVMARIKELRDSVASEAITSAADLVKLLMPVAVVDVPARSVRAADKVAAIDKIAKILGLYRDAEQERPRPVITHITVILDHSSSGSGPSLYKEDPAVIEGEVVASDESGASSDDKGASSP